ncbi:hypothetical protein [Parapedobacter sp.]
MKRKTVGGIMAALVVTFALGASAWGIFTTFSKSGPSEREREELIRTGTPGMATLLSIERTGNIVNSIHQYKFSFHVRPDSGATFASSEKKLIDPIYMSLIKKGMQIPVYVGNTEDKQVLILWEKAGIGDAF